MVESTDALQAKQWPSAGKNHPIRISTDQKRVVSGLQSLVMWKSSPSIFSRWKPKTVWVEWQRGEDVWLSGAFKP